MTLIAYYVDARNSSQEFWKHQKLDTMQSLTLTRPAMPLAQLRPYSDSYAHALWLVHYRPLANINPTQFCG